MKCSNCASENRPGLKFCENCGQALPRRCDHCGETVSASAKYCGNCGAALTSAHEPSPAEVSNRLNQVERLSALQKVASPDLQEKMRRASAKIEGERKPVTILFADIVGSTTYAERLDAEDWRDVVRGAHQIISEVVYHYEGIIAQLLGDGVLAFFGAPITHEDDPLRAVQAALEIQAGISAYASRLPASVSDFRLRTGINTGTVVVGNIGDQLHMEYLAIGDAVNLAARLQSAAEPGKLLISENTYPFIRHAVELLDLGEIPVKGKARPVHIYQVEALKAVHDHGRRHTGLESRMVGRQAEISALLTIGEAVQAGLGRVALVIGEPGLGKSRLLAEWTREQAQGITWVKGECLSYGQGLAYHLVIDWLHNLLGLSTAATETEAQAALSHLTGELLGADAAETEAFLSHLLGLPLSAAAQGYISGLNPQGFQVQYLAALRRTLSALANRQPLGLIFEDIHWADSASVELLTRLLPLVSEAPLLFCFVTRLEQNTPGWKLVEAARATLGAALTEINLYPLSAGEMSELAANLLASASLPEKVRSLVIAKSEGNPLFVEEVLNMLLERRVLVRGDDGQLTVTGNLEALEIPDNLKLLVLARIDRLPEEPKRTLRVASVIGREFLVKILAEMLAGIGQQQIHSHLLSQLSALEFTSLIQLAATHPDIGYLFHHALVQEAAYEAVLKSDRLVLHRAAAEALERLYPDRLDELAATLAYHFERAEAPQQALYYLLRAAERARQTYANAEAIALYRAAIGQVEVLQKQNPSNPALLNQAIELRQKLGDVLVHVGQHEAGRALYEEALAVAPANDLVLQARLYTQIGMTWIVPRAFTQALAIYEQGETILGAFPEDPQPAWLFTWIDLQLERLWAYYWMQDLSSMQTLIDRLGPIIEAQDSAHQRARYYLRWGPLTILRDRYWPGEQTLQIVQEARSAAIESDDPVLISFSTFVLGFALMMRGDLDQAEKFLLEALAQAERIGDMERIVLTSTYLTVTFRIQKQVDQVKQWVLRAQAAAHESKIPVYIALAAANQAWVAYQEGDLPGVETNTRQALEIYSKAPFPFSYLACWPIIAVELNRDQVAAAVESARRMLDPHVRRLPAEIEIALQQAVQLFESGDRDQSKATLGLAVQLAIDTGFF